MRIRDNKFDILDRELDKEILERMPEWFNILRSAYRTKIKP
jgi:hypothetical protein